MDRYVCSECGLENPDNAVECVECGGFVECIEVDDPPGAVEESQGTVDATDILLTRNPLLSAASWLALSSQGGEPRGTPWRVFGWGSAAVAAVSLVLVIGGPFTGFDILGVASGLSCSVGLVTLAIPAIALACSIRLGLDRASTKDLVAIGIYWAILMVVGVVWFSVFLRSSNATGTPT